jgi:hypothetical protein
MSWEKHCKVKRLTLWLPEEYHAFLKSQSKAENVTMSKVIRRYIFALMKRSLKYN